MISLTHFHPALFSLIYSNRLDLLVTPRPLLIIIYIYIYIYIYILNILIFCNLTSHEVISGNITATISDHLPQFLIAPYVFPNPSSNKSKIFEKNWSHFNQEYFVHDYY